MVQRNPCLQQGRPAFDRYPNHLDTVLNYYPLLLRAQHMILMDHQTHQMRVSTEQTLINLTTNTAPLHISPNMDILVPSMTNRSQTKASMRPQLIPVAKSMDMVHPPPRVMGVGYLGQVRKVGGPISLISRHRETMVDNLARTLDGIEHN